jgi:DNA-binding NarL/FixJ family response regulator
LERRGDAAEGPPGAAPIARRDHVPVGGSTAFAAVEAAVTIRLLVADDQDIVRAGLDMILGAQPGIEVVGEAADALLTQAIHASAQGDALIAPNISISTVETHLASLMRELEARNRVELALWAYETDRTRS